MSRYTLLQKELTKGVKLDDKAGSIIGDWTPNNLRRLIIGFEGAIVQYYVAVGKFSSEFQFIDFSNADDVIEYKNGTLDLTGVKSLTNLLGKDKVNSRVMSNIEEVVFIDNGYPEQLLVRDCDQEALTNSVDLKRLQGVIRVSGPAITRESYGSWVKLASVEEVKSGKLLLADIISTKTKFAVSNIYVGDTSKKANLSLRKEKYYLDGDTGKLAVTLRGLVDSYTTESKESLHKSKLAQTYAGDIKMHSEHFNILFAEIVKLTNKIKETHRGLNPFQLDDWGNYLALIAATKKDVSMYKDLTPGSKTANEYTGLNIPELTSMFTEVGVKPDVLLSLLAQLNKFYGLEAGSDDKLVSGQSVVTSLKLITILAVSMVNVLADVVYLSLVAYLSSMGKSNIIDMRDRVLGEGYSLTYTKQTAEFCNKNCKLIKNADLDTEGVFTLLGFELVSIAELSARVRAGVAMDILSAIGGR